MSKEQQPKSNVSVAMSERQAPSPQDLRPVPAHILEFEKRDEAAILRELEGEQIEEFVYTATIQGKTVTSLSITGTREAARRRGNFSTENPIVSYTSDEVTAIVKVHDLENNAEFVGAASARLNQPFAFVLSINKAERNALNKMLPAKWIASLIKEYLYRTRPNVKKVETEPPTQQSPTSKQPETSADGNTITATRQEPIFNKLTAVGTADIDGNAGIVTFRPDTSISADAGPIQYFLISKVFEAEKSKHDDFTYNIDADEVGTLRAVVVKAQLDPDRLKKLLDAVGWAFAKAAQPTTN